MAEPHSLAPPASRAHEVGAKLAFVQSLLERRGLAAVVLTGTAPVAWLAVEEETLTACVPGATYGEVLRTLAAAYAAAGHPGAWADHYQGGPVGYRQREFEIVPTQTSSRWFGTSLEPGHAVAWNPSIGGGDKAEDTYLVGADELRRLTDTGTWPLDGRRPGVLDITTGEAAL